MTQRTASLIVALAAALAACGGGDGGDDDPGGFPDAAVDAPPGPDAGPTATETRTLTLGSGRFTEAEFVAGPGDAVRVVMTAPRPDLTWNIHGHANGGTQIIVEEDGVMEVDYWFEPTSQADWWLMPGNGGDAPLTIDVTMHFFGDATFTRWF